MALVEFRHPSQKPQVGPLNLDLGNDLSAGLVSALVLNDFGGGKPFDLANQSRVTTQGGTWTRSTLGAAISTAGSSGSFVQEVAPPGLSAPVSAGVFTIACCVRQDASGAGYVFGLANEGSNRLDQAIIYGFVASTWETYQGADATGGRNTIKSGSDSNFHTVIMIVDGTRQRAYFDGLEVVNVTMTNPSLSGTWDLTLGDSGRNTDLFAGTFVWAYAWNRALTAGEAADLTLYPYSMWQTRPTQRWPVIPVVIGLPPGFGPAAQMQEPAHFDTAMMR